MIFNVNEFINTKKRILRDECKEEDSPLFKCKDCFGKGFYKKRGYNDEICWICNGDGFISEEVFKI